MKDQSHSWLSMAKLRMDLRFGFTILEQDEDPQALKALIALINSVNSGKAVPAENFPDSMWIAPSYRKDDKRKLPAFFYANGLTAVSSEFASVIRDANIGKTKLIPVRLFKSNRTDQFPGDYFFLNIAEMRQRFSAEQSARFQAVPETAKPLLGAPFGSANDGDLTLAPAQDEVDLWKDNTILAEFFLSSRLHDALKRQKLLNRLPVVRCETASVN